MPGPLRDSISRCDREQYASPYTVQNHREIKIAQTNTEKSKPKDTLEISKEQLKEEALKRLRNTSKFIVPENGFIRIGKFVFTGLTLPPYLFLYRIPKWVFFTIGPIIFTAFEKQVAKVSQKSKPKIQFIKSKFKAAWIKLTKKLNVVKVFEGPLQNIRKNIAICLQQITHLFSSIKRIGKFKENVVDSRRTISEKIKNIRTKVSHFIDGIINVGSKAFEWIKENGFSFFKKVTIFSKGKSQQLGKQTKINFSMLYRSLSVCREKGKAKAEKSINWLLKHKTKYASIFKQTKEQFLTKYFENFHPIILKTAEQTKSLFKRILKILNDKKQRFFSFIEDRLKKLYHFSNKKEFLKNLYQYFPHSMRDRVKKVLEKHYTQLCLRFLAKSLFFFSSKAWKIVLLVLKLSKIVSLKSYNFIKILLKYLKEGLEILFLSYLTTVWKYFKKALFVGIYQFLVFTIMFAILVSWGFKGLSETANVFLTNK